MTDPQPKITHVFMQVHYADAAPTFAEFRPPRGRPADAARAGARHAEHQDIPVHPSDVRISVSDVEHTLMIKHIGTGTLRTEAPIPYNENDHE